MENDCETCKCYWAEKQMCLRTGKNCPARCKYFEKSGFMCKDREADKDTEKAREILRENYR